MVHDTRVNGTMSLDWSDEADSGAMIGAVNGWQYIGHGDVAHHNWRYPRSHALPYRNMFGQPRINFLHGVSIGHKFEELANDWRSETMVLSDLTEILLNRSYQRIIGLGPDVVPLVLERLRDRAEPWYWALQSLTGHEPQGVDDGDFQELRRFWLEWGRDIGFL